MKREFAILTGSLFLSLATNVSAQSVGPPNQAFINPSSLLTTSSSTAGRPPTPRWKHLSVNEEVLKGCCEKLENDKRRIYYLNARDFRMGMQVKGIYTRDGLIFFRLFLCNHSHLDYEIDSIRFYITDNHWLKNAPVQIIGLPPVYIYGNARTVRGKSREFPIIVLPQFTLPTGKHLVIELLERNGNRHLQLQAYNYTLLRSRLI
jgi:hypothetical protein